MEIDYIGNELTLFSHATNWKNYWGNIVRPFLGKEVLDVGAGIGSTAALLNDPEKIDSWTYIEPDSALAAEILQKIETGELAKNGRVLTAILSDQKPDKLYDSLLYIDVIEHIEHDADELALAFKFLKPGGHLIVVVPAHQFLYSPFDQAIGHFRRYNKEMLRKAAPSGLTEVKLRYLDSLGMLASMTNRYFLKQDYPKLKQVLFWDKTIVPVSKLMDPVLGYSLGKSLVGIWRK